MPGEAPIIPLHRTRLDWLEGGVVLVAVAWVEASAWRLPLRDTPIGVDWPRYLGNAVAIGEGHWQQYQLWRGPLHALACLALSPIAGLLEASQAVSMVAVGAVIVASAALGRRVLGYGHGALTAVLLAGWPDLALQARMSTPYPLLAALVACALLALDCVSGGPEERRVSPEHTAEPTRRAWRVWAARPWATALAAGVLFGLAGVTDARGMALAGTAVGGAMLAAGLPIRAPTPSLRRTTRIGALAVVFGIAVVVREGILACLPVDLLSLGQQVALQRDLHAREGGIQACFDHHAAAVQISELWSACARQTVLSNLHRLSPMAPLPLVAVGGIALAGLRRRLAPVIGMVLTIVPAALLVGLEHRYLLPLAGPGAVLLASGVARTGELLARVPSATAGQIRQNAPQPPHPAVAHFDGSVRWRERSGVVLAIALAGALAIGWRTHADTLIARASANRPAPGPPRVQLATPPPITFVRGWFRLHAPVDSHIIDCAGLGLDVRLYPRAVDEASANGRSSGRCVRLLTGPPSPHTLVLTRTPPPNPAWTTAFSAGDLLIVSGG